MNEEVLSWLSTRRLLFRTRGSTEFRCYRSGPFSNGVCGATGTTFERDVASTHRRRRCRAFSHQLRDTKKTEEGKREGTPEDFPVIMVPSWDPSLAMNMAHDGMRNGESAVWLFWIQPGVTFQSVCHEFSRGRRGSSVLEEEVVNRCHVNFCCGQCHPVVKQNPAKLTT